MEVFKKCHVLRDTLEVSCWFFRWHNLRITGSAIFAASREVSARFSRGSRGATKHAKEPRCSSHFHVSSKKPASAIFPGQRGPGGSRKSMIAKSGSFGVWSELVP